MDLSTVVLSALNQPALAGDLAGLAGWQWLLICLAAILIVGWLLMSSASFSAQSPYLENLAHHSEESHDVRAPTLAPSGSPDDLKTVEGIGPKIEALLHAEGITTFAQLAQSDVERLREILLASGLRISDPTTWPEQAHLAASEDWDGLNALQESLKGGRRV